jgi:large conductance mechanosensitive channel
MIKDFKEFLLKQNALALAIGVNIGAAIGKVVSSIAEDVINPVIGLLLLGATGAARRLSSPMEWTPPESRLETAITYGHLIGSAGLLVIALVIFMIEGLHPEAGRGQPATKECPQCREIVPRRDAVQGLHAALPLDTEVSGSRAALARFPEIARPTPADPRKGSRAKEVRMRKANRSRSLLPPFSGVSRFLLRQRSRPEPWTRSTSTVRRRRISRPCRGVGAATAKKIIAGRPFSSVQDLSWSGFRPRRSTLKPLVKAGRGSSAAAAEPAKETKARQRPRRKPRPRRAGGVAEGRRPQSGQGNQERDEIVGLRGSPRPG